VKNSEEVATTHSSSCAIPAKAIVNMDERLRLDSGAATQFLVAFIQQALSQAGYHRAVLGLSGGIDSAVSCFLTARAIGPENVLALWMPYRTSASESRVDAERVVAQLGVPSRTVDITPMVDPYLDQMPGISPRRRGNVMARCRMIVLYDHSEEWQGLVIGTSNKTELWLGYGTLFGDMACAINPLGDLYKTQVRQLATALSIPSSIITKPPSADLWAGQTDEGEIGFLYEDLDRALYLLIDEGISVDQAIAYGLPAQLVEGVWTRMQRSAFKRCIPTIARLPS
jgi:NAD+ synthase